MTRVSFTANLMRHLSVSPTEVSATTVRGALEAVFATNPELRTCLLDDQGRLRRHVNVFVNGRLAQDRNGLSDPVGENDDLFVFEALSVG